MAVDVPEVLLEAQLHVVGGRVVTVGVGRLDEQYVGTGRILVVAQDGLVRLAEVAGEQEPVAVPVVGAYV